MIQCLIFSINLIYQSDFSSSPASCSCCRPFPFWQFLEMLPVVGLPGQPMICPNWSNIDNHFPSSSTALQRPFNSFPFGEPTCPHFLVHIWLFKVFPKDNESVFLTSRNILLFHHWPLTICFSVVPRIGLTTNKSLQITIKLLCNILRVRWRLFLLFRVFLNPKLDLYCFPTLLQSRPFFERKFFFSNCGQILLTRWVVFCVCPKLNIVSVCFDLSTFGFALLTTTFFLPSSPPPLFPSFPVII